MIGCLFRSGLRTMSQTTGKGVDLEKITNFLEKFAPKVLAEQWDNTGLLVEPTVPRPVENILLTNDLTDDVISEALDLHAGLIISYHPPIFKPLKKITQNSWKERIIAACLENKIAVYSPHTSWDNVAGGVNDWLASAFNVEDIKPLKRQQTEVPSYFGIGRHCILKSGIKISEAIDKVKKHTQLEHLNVAIGKGRTFDSIINDVAVCAGSGASVLDGASADLFLTGEMSHHSLLDAIHNGTSVILCNHSNSERGFLKDFMAKLNLEFGTVNVFVSKMDKDPMIVV